MEYCGQRSSWSNTGTARPSLACNWTPLRRCIWTLRFLNIWHLYISLSIPVCLKSSIKSLVMCPNRKTGLFSAEMHFKWSRKTCQIYVKVYMYTYTCVYAQYRLRSMYIASPQSLAIQCITSVTTYRARKCAPLWLMWVVNALRYGMPSPSAEVCCWCRATFSRTRWLTRDVSLLLLRRVTRRVDPLSGRWVERGRLGY